MDRGMKIGNAPISWGICEIPNWGPQLPYTRVLQEMAEAGYAGTELGPWGYFPTESAHLKLLLEEAGLQMAAAFVPLDLRSPGRLEEELPNVRETAGLLHALGAQHIVVSDSGDAMRSAIAGRAAETAQHGFTDEQWRYFADSLHTIADVCADMGLELCFHSHGGTYVEHPDEIARLCEMTDGSLVKLCLDTGHIAFGGGDPVQLFQAYRDRIGHVHLKDIKLDLLRRELAQGSDYATAAKADVFVALGQGDVDLEAIVTVLKEAEYTGWVIVEQDRVLNENDDSMAAPLASRRYLSEKFGL